MRHDVVHALRVLWRERTTSGIAVATLALGIGFTVAVFSVADRVVFRPLPYPEPHQLVELRLAGMPTGYLPLSSQELAAARAASIFSGAEAFSLGGAITRIDGPEPERVRLAQITPGLLSLLGARIVHGRPLQRSDTIAGAEPVALLDYEFWRSRYGSDPGVVGRMIRFDEAAPMRIAGVLDRDFVFPASHRPFSPQVIEPVAEQDYAMDGRWLTVIARLRPGLDPAAAERAIAADPAYEGSNVHVAARPLQVALGYSARGGLVALFVAALGLLLIAGTDVAGLLVAKSTTRDREILVRRAIGAGTWRIARQFLVEGGIVAALSCAAGLLLAMWVFDSLMAAVPPDLQLIQPVGIDARAIAFAGAIAGLLALLFGSAPLLHIRGRGGASVLRVGSTQSAGPVVRRFGSALVATQIALALALLVGGGLLLSSFLHIRAIDVGMRAEGVAFVRTGLPRAEARHTAARYRDLLGSVRALEDVSAAGANGAPMFESSYRRTRFRPVGRPAPPARGRVSDIQSEVTPGYFEAMGIPVLEGRSFATADMRGGAEPVAVVSAGLARRWWPDAPAVGQKIALRDETRTIIGVVGDVRQIHPKWEAPGELYVPLSGPDAPSTATLVIRSSNPNAALDRVTALVRGMVPGIVVLSALTAEDHVAARTQADRFYTLLLGLIAAAGLGLAALGAYGMLDWSIGRRRREIGIRAALGATPVDLVRSVAGQLVRPFAVGLLGGLVLARWGSRLLASLLFDVQPDAAGVWTAGALTLTAMLALAMIVPARRAATISPAEALRTD